MIENKTRTWDTSRLYALMKKAEKHMDRLYLIILFTELLYYTSLKTLLHGSGLAFAAEFANTLLILVALYKLAYHFMTDKKSIIPQVLVLAAAYIYSAASGSDDFLRIAMLMVGAWGIRAERIFWTAALSKAVILVTAYISSLTGYVEMRTREGDFFWFGGDEFFTNPIYGHVHSTDLGAHFFWLAAAVLFARLRKIKLAELPLWYISALFVYSISAANTALIGMLLLAFTATAAALANKGADIPWTRLEKLAAILSFAVFSAGIIACTYFYSDKNSFFVMLNNKLHTRLSLGSHAIRLYGVSLFGRSVPMKGAGSDEYYYNFIDSSYIETLVCGGIYAFAVIIALFTAIQYKCIKNGLRYGTWILTIAALSCVEEHHLRELGFNTLYLLMFADISKPKAVKIKAWQKKAYISVCAVVPAVLVVLVVSSNLKRAEDLRQLKELDNKAKEVYTAVQTRLTELARSGEWYAFTGDCNSKQLGEPMAQLNDISKVANNTWYVTADNTYLTYSAMEPLKYNVALPVSVYNISPYPDDYNKNTGRLWQNDITDIAHHRFYSLNGKKLDDGSCPKAYELLLDGIKTDNAVIEDDNIIVEYDAVTAEVYSVWYTEGCEAAAVSQRSKSLMRRMDGAMIGYYCGRHYNNEAELQNNNISVTEDKDGLVIKDKTVGDRLTVTFTGKQSGVTRTVLLKSPEMTGESFVFKADNALLKAFDDEKIDVKAVSAEERGECAAEYEWTR